MKMYHKYKKAFLLFVNTEKMKSVLHGNLEQKQIKHNNSKKKLFIMKNAILKIYDFPIFYFPRLSHPDPTVDRRSGFLVPIFF